MIVITMALLSGQTFARQLRVESKVLDATELDQIKRVDSKALFATELDSGRIKRVDSKALVATELTSGVTITRKDYVCTQIDANLYGGVVSRAIVRFLKIESNIDQHLSTLSRLDSLHLWQQRSNSRQDPVQTAVKL